MSQYPPTPREAGSDSVVQEIITDLNFQLLPEALHMDPGHDAIRRAGEAGLVHFLRTLKFAEVLRFDRRAVHQLMGMYESFGWNKASVPQPSIILRMFEVELSEQQMHSIRRYNTNPNAALVWRPTNELIRRLMQADWMHYCANVKPNERHYTNMQGMRLIACDEPGISVAWLPSLHTERE